MASKPMLKALLTSIAYKQSDSSVHGRTDGRTNEDELTLRSYLSFRIARGGA